MGDKLTIKAERFALALASGLSQRQAYKLSGYSHKAATETLDQNACRLANSSKVIARVEAIKAKATSDTVSSILERKEKLSEIIRGDIRHYVTDDGVNLDGVPTGAIAEVSVKTKIYKKEGEPVKIEAVKLYNPIQAIEALNRMDADTPDNTINIIGGNILIDARQKIADRVNSIALRSGENGNTPELDG